GGRASAAAKRKGKGRKRASASGGASAVLTPGGNVALIASTAKGHRLRGIGPGDRAARLRNRTRRLGQGIWIRKLHKARAVYVVPHKRVQTVAIAGPAAHRRKALRSYLKLIPSKGFDERGTLQLARHTLRKLHSRRDISLVQANEHGSNLFYCSLGL